MVPALLALTLILVYILFLTGGGKTDTPEPKVMVTGPAAVPKPRRPEQEAIDLLETDKIVLAKMVWGETRGCSTIEQAAVIWCVLSCYDSGDRFWADTVEDITTQPCQFYGYDPGNPVGPDILALVEDVLARWMAGRDRVGSMGRVLPREYLYFTGGDIHNYFATEWRGG